MRSLILTFSGPIGSGKSTLSKSVAQSLGWKHSSFGHYVRELASQRGVGNSREALQRLGASLIEEKGWDNFCRSVLAQVDWAAGQNIVLDGIRHIEALDSLRIITKPSKILLVLLALSGPELAARRSGREVFENLKRVESHSTEEQVINLLPQRADLIVDGRRRLEDVVNEVVQWVQERLL